VDEILSDKKWPRRFYAVEASDGITRVFDNVGSGLALVSFSANEWIGPWRASDYARMLVVQLNWIEYVNRRAAALASTTPG